MRPGPRRVEYAVWLRHPVEEPHEPGVLDSPPAGKRLVNEILRTTPTADLAPAERPGAGAYGIHCWRRARSRASRPRWRRPRSLGWDVVLKATPRAPAQLAPGPRPRVVAIDTPAEMEDALDRRGRGPVSAPEDAGSIAAPPPPGVPVAITSWRTRCSGRWCRSASAASTETCSPTGPTGIPAAGAAGRRRHGARDQVVAAAVRLPRQRGGQRRRPRRSLIPAGVPAPARPAPGAPWRCRWRLAGARDISRS